jgi:hypothetical protein
MHTLLIRALFRPTRERRDVDGKGVNRVFPASQPAEFARLHVVPWMFPGL